MPQFNHSDLLGIWLSAHKFFIHKNNSSWNFRMIQWFVFQKKMYRIEILQNYKIYIQIIKIHFLYSEVRLPDGLRHYTAPRRTLTKWPSGKRDPLYNCWTLEKWYRLSGRSVSSMTVLVRVCPNKLFLVSVRLNIEHSMKLIGRTSNQLLKITNKSINISEIFIGKTVFWGLDEVWNYSWEVREL